MTGLPTDALSVRQPWAWAIVHAGKDIENRDWKPKNPARRFRGRTAIHASKGMTRGEYEDARDFMRVCFGIICPPAVELQRGGIIGSVEIVDVVSESPSGWFFGPLGLVLRDPLPCDFIPAVGALGYFAWQPAPGPLSTPARWMLLSAPAKPPQPAPAPPAPQEKLL